MAKKNTVQAADSNEPPACLTWAQERFIEEYLRHGNGSLAYLNSHPKCSPGSSRVGASRMLTNTNVLAAIDAKRDADRELLNFGRQEALKILIGMATASLDDFAPLFSDCADQEKYVGLGYKRHALDSAKKTVITQDDGSEKEINEIKIISPGERKAVINDLWDKLGLGEASSKGNWFDGLEQLAELIRGSKKEK